MQQIKAIETRYKGYRFRSRLEARWAVFFETLGLRWEYEPQGFHTDAGPYLPDFLLPEMNTFVEVKHSGYKPSPDEEARWKSLVWGTRAPLLLAIGPPAPVGYQLLEVFNPAQAVADALNGGVPCLPDRGDVLHVWTVCFNSKYLPPNNHDGRPRLYREPGSQEDADCVEACVAARSARFEHGEVPA